MSNETPDNTSNELDTFNATPLELKWGDERSDHDPSSTMEPDHNQELPEKLSAREALDNLSPEAQEVIAAADITTIEALFNHYANPGRDGGLYRYNVPTPWIEASGAHSAITKLIENDEYDDPVLATTVEIAQGIESLRDYLLDQVVVLISDAGEITEDSIPDKLVELRKRVIDKRTERSQSAYPESDLLLDWESSVYEVARSEINRLQNTLTERYLDLSIGESAYNDPERKEARNDFKAKLHGRRKELEARKPEWSRNPLPDEASIHYTRQDIDDVKATLQFVRDLEQSKV